MFSIFKSDDAESERKRAQEAYEKVVSLRADSRDARSLRVRMGLMCRAHLDKTFIAGAEQTATHQEVSALAIAQGKERPPPPKHTLFQKVPGKGKEILVYLPEQYVEQAFSLGARYQKTEINARQAIDLMQAIADQICIHELQMDTPFQALQFLRDEIAGSDPIPDEGDGAEPREPSPPEQT